MVNFIKINLNGRTLKTTHMKKDEKALSRRQFVGASAIGFAGIMIFPASCMGKTAGQSNQSKPVRLGFIGLGRQAIYLMDGFIRIAGVEVIAGCDVYGIKRTRFEKRVNAFYEKEGKKTRAVTFERYEELLGRSDIDAVVIATPDHAHAITAIAALKAGKDVYLEKPLTFTVFEGQQLRKTVRETGRILGVGSQQRSDPNFRHAVNLVQSGALGSISTVNAYVGPPPRPYDLPAEPVPADLNWDLWLGPLPASIHYNSELAPPISLKPERDEEFWAGWRWYTETGGGYTADWGAHMFDIAQWALGMDGNGPVEIAPLGDSSEYITWKYKSGTVMNSLPFNEKKTRGVKFTGEKGWIEVSREHYLASDGKFNPPAQEKKDSGPYETKIPHQVNFIESVRRRVDPVANVEAGHSTCTACNLGNIAVRLGRTLEWDPVREKFTNDTDGEATALLHYTYREPWKLI